MTAVNLSETVLVDRPLRQVFAYATDYRNDVYWRQGVTQMMVEPPGPSGLGTRTFETMRSYGRRLQTEAEITRFEPYQCSDFRSIRGPMPVSGARIFEARGNQTQVTYTLAVELDALFSLLWPLLKTSFRRQIAGDLQRLKKIIESAPGPAAEPAAKPAA